MKLRNIIAAISLVLVFVFRDLLMSLLLGSSKKKYIETKEKDYDLRKEIDDLNRESEILKDKANDLKPNEVDEDWHLKDKK